MSKKVDKTPQKRQAWIARTAEALAISEAAAVNLLRTKRKQSIRLNPLRGSAQEILHELSKLGWAGSQFSWVREGYNVSTAITELRDSPLVTDGKIFIQNAASWLPVIALDPQPGELILDVCAAPGGKTSHVAAITNNQAHIWANDNSRPRLAKLQVNMKRLGANAERYTLFDATMLSQRLEGQQFDKILLDAPCSGEGLMNLDNDAEFKTWSVAHIKRLQKLQRRILAQVWQLLKPGGILVYSTCTLAPEENEAAIDYILRKNDDAELVLFDVGLPNRVPAVSSWNNRPFSPEIAKCMRLIPSECIEAFFVAKLKKVAI
jgi:NOL1/NOP2/sun family putative RNA methylase